MPKGKRHGNLDRKASQIYEALRRDHPNYGKTKSAKIANAVAHHHAGHGIRGRKGR